MSSNDRPPSPSPSPPPLFPVQALASPSAAPLPVAEEESDRLPDNEGGGSSRDSNSRDNSSRSRNQRGSRGRSERSWSSNNKVAPEESTVAAGREPGHASNVSLGAVQLGSYATAAATAASFVANDDERKDKASAPHSAPQLPQQPSPQDDQQQQQHSPPQFSSYSAMSLDPTSPSPPPPWNLTSPLSRTEIEGSSLRDVSGGAPEPFSSPGLEPRCGCSVDELCAWLSFWARYFGRWLHFHLHPHSVRRAWGVRHWRALLLTTYISLASLMFILLFYYNGFASFVGAPYGPPQEVTCHAVAWGGSNSRSSSGGCGLNGADCQPFASDTWAAVRCPSRCTLLDTTNTVLGGGRGGIYRADSHICMAALHAGVIESDKRGGCFLYRPAGAQPFYRSAGRHNGLTSIGFPSWFPGSIEFASAPDAKHCSNFGGEILVALLLFFLPLCLLRPPPLLLWLSMILLGYWYAALTLNDRFTQRRLFWDGIGLGLWIAVLFGLVLYRLAPRHSLRVEPAQLDDVWQQWPWCAFTLLRQRLGLGGGGAAAADKRRHGRRVSSQSAVPAVPFRQPSPRGLRVQIHAVPPGGEVGGVANDGITVASGALGSPLMPEGASPSPSPGPPSVSGGGDHSASFNDDNPLASPSAPVDDRQGSRGGSASSSLNRSHASPSLSESPPATSVRYHPPRFPLSVTDPRSDGATVPATAVHMSPVSSYAASSSQSAAPSVGSTSLWRARCRSIRAALSPPLPPRGAKGRDALVMRAWFDLYFLYVVPFLLGLHLSYVAYISSSADVDLDSSLFSHGATGIVVILVVGVVVLAIVLYTCRLGFRANILARYLAYYFAAAIVALVVSLLWAGQALFHLHHVLVGMLLLPLSRFPSRISLLLQSFALGVFLNGLAIWGLTAAWDVSSAPLPLNLRIDPVVNQPPDVVQLTNATSNSMWIGWPLPHPLSQAIGSSLQLNQIEIYHSTWVDSTYGGGYTPPPPNSSTIATLEDVDAAAVVMPPVRVLHVSEARSSGTSRRHHVHRNARAGSDEAVAADVTGDVSSPESEELLRSIQSFHSSARAGEKQSPLLTFRFFGDRVAAPIVLPFSSSPSMVPRRHLAPRSIVHQRILPPAKDALARLLSWHQGDHADVEAHGVEEEEEEEEQEEASCDDTSGADADADAAALVRHMFPASSLSPSPLLTSPSAPKAGLYYTFQLINLLPNTSYLLIAGFIEPGGDVNLGGPIVIRTCCRP